MCIYYKNWKQQYEITCRHLKKNTHREILWGLSVKDSVKIFTPGFDHDVYCHASAQILCISSLVTLESSILGRSLSTSDMLRMIAM